jgi:DNA-binding transcriptional regulator YbjK
MSRVRLDPDQRSKQILNVALEIAERDCYTNVTRQNVAVSAEVSVSLITHYYDSADKLRDAVVRAAVRRENLEVIGQGIANKNKYALSAPAELKERAAIHIMNR